MSWSIDDFHDALDFAGRAHGDQKVPGTPIPYVVHLVKVATEVIHAWEASKDFDVKLATTCALLHDSMEDAGVTRDALVKTFGEPVAAGVHALTKDEALEKSQRMADSLRRLKQQPRDVQLVKLCDRITNLEPPPHYWPREKRVAYRDEAKVILSELGGAHAGLAKRLQEKIDAYPRYFDAAPA
jgi:(p)ppGpp synthase/HD superfamily hydrolase